jgi:hypothetical protein
LFLRQLSAHIIFSFGQFDILGPAVFSALAALKRGFLTRQWHYKKFLKKSQKTLDLLWAIWFNAIISLGAEEKTHSRSNTFIAL